MFQTIDGHDPQLTNVTLLPDDQQLIAQFLSSLDICISDYNNLKSTSTVISEVQFPKWNKINGFTGDLSNDDKVKKWSDEVTKSLRNNNFKSAEYKGLTARFFYHTPLLL